MAQLFQMTFSELLNLRHCQTKQVNANSKAISVAVDFATNKIQESLRPMRTAYDNLPDWTSIAPEVALRLKGEPRSKSHTEWRWGNKGSFAFYTDKGTFRDYEAGVSGGVIDMVSHCEGLDKQGAIQWLKDNNFLPQNRAPDRPRPHKPTPAPKPTNKPHDHGNLPYGLRLWNEARSVPVQADHPVRLWSRGLLAPSTPMPHAIRFHRERGFVVCCVATLANWIDAYPGTPTPQAAHLIAITPQGEKRFPAEWKGDNKRTFGRVEGSGIFAIGNLGDDTINLCEGVADALSILEREPGAIIASLTTFAKLISHHSLITHIAARNPVIFPDMDEAGRNATDKLTQTLNRAGATVKIRQGMSGDDPADSARKVRI